ncbi:hypothetical protein LguiA_012996 [Lonicera macranthoides]
MEKGLQLTSKLQKCSRRGSKDVYLVDRISELPDEILEFILSRLRMREAVRTSVLSRRWKDLWTFTTGSLDFDFGSKVLLLINEFNLSKILEPERARYISMVNKIVNTHKGATIDAFKVEFDLQLSHKSDIDSWINFALGKRVRKLELKLEPADLVDVPVNRKNYYPFPAQSLGDSNISCLTSLNLDFVNVSGEDLEYLLSHCPFLEFLSISCSPVLVDVMVIAPCAKLKHLEIADCNHLKSLDISCAQNLTSLAYSGRNDRGLSFRNVPNLSNVSLGGFYCVYLVQKFHELPIALSQIEKLQLNLCTTFSPGFPKFPLLQNVKQLELSVQAFDNHSLLSCASVMEACPNLYRFSMLFDWLGKPGEREVQQMENCSMHKCLKVLELLWFRGSTTDVELATYLLSSAPFLEKIYIDTRNPYLLLRTTFGQFEEENVSAKKCVRRLAEQLSPGAELLTL